MRYFGALPSSVYFGQFVTNYTMRASAPMKSVVKTSVKGIVLYNNQLIPPSDVTGFGMCFSWPSNGIIGNWW